MVSNPQLVMDILWATSVDICEHDFWIDDVDKTFVLKFIVLGSDSVEENTEFFTIFSDFIIVESFGEESTLFVNAHGPS